MRGIGMQAMAFRSLANNDLIPPGGFDQDVAGVFGDHGVEATHHTGKTDGLFSIGNDEVFTSKFAFDAVKGFEPLAVFGFANDDLPALEQVHVEDVSWFADLPQNVIRGVDGVADRALIEKREPLRGFFRRAFDFYIADRASAEARAEIAFGDHDR